MRTIPLALLLSGAATVAHAATIPVFNKYLGIAFPLVPHTNAGSFFDNGIFHVNGDWNSPYCSGGKSGHILQANTTWQSVGGRQTLVMTVPAHTCDAAEIASDRGWTFNSGRDFPYGQTGYGYGYYEVRMKSGYGPANAVHDNVGGTGTCESFFLKGLSHGQLGAPEIDFEFLTSGSWDKPGSQAGVVWVTLMGPQHTVGSVPISLPFNPSAAFHRYGIGFQPGQATFYVDGSLVYTARTSDAVLPADGLLIMANNWTGNPNWGGTPPAVDVKAYYRRISFYAGLSAPPSTVRRATETFGPAGD